MRSGLRHPNIETAYRAEKGEYLLARLTRAGVTVVLFNLREPSLHEIFVETVGGESDA